MFGLFKKKDPVCGMKEEKDKGIRENGEWFCSSSCLEEYKKRVKRRAKHGGGCCH